MTQFDARMGFAPALLCIEEEPLKKTVSVNFGFRGRTNDPFEVGDHSKVSVPTKIPKLMQVVQVREEDCVQGARAERFAAHTKFQDPTCSINEYMDRYAHGLGVHAELTFYTNEHVRRVFRGANDKENKTATEIQMQIREAEQRMLRSVLDNMSVSRPMPAPSGLSMLMEAERQREKQLRHANNAGSGAEGLKNYTSGGDGWFDGPPPCAGWWEASKSKHEGHYRRWDGSRWSAHATVTRDGECSNEFAWRQLEPEEKSNKVKWRPFTPPWESTKTLVLERGRPVLYMPSEEDPLCQLRIRESFSSSSAYDRSVKLRMLTKEKCDAAAARLDAAINGKPIDPKNVSLADVNAKLSELSGPTLKFKRFKPQLTGAIDWGFDPAKADES